ncbi:hypothetical protein GUITHDRAFT_146264 [Guillardia theta CCMP2712]|uniref:8-oxo-dGTP diphosphatase n=1 Tax=Guillardia theta (strain CCMP2712) TaxID=905079 RepID=L1IIA4_GUITC|nr:hypothetical protein GUITHDRAFT_146264 [Guillardia theta CCMP2712]EKX35807.1 hypothetical protein GUITHDRAFT_146264 [Guillardia theta CCMP2712]|eukprot:XP_005822787.1 hypothetical protein GUITHDRAFT_146264 [Guillardia theta CCMP2712]
MNMSSQCAENLAQGGAGCMHMRAESSSKPLKRVVGAVVLRGDEVFMAKRQSSKDYGGMWEFPGGKVEEGEDDQTALKREMQEEFSVDLRVGDFLASGDDGRIELFCYLAEMLGDPVLSEHEECRWVGLADLQDLEVPPADKPAISRLQKMQRR